MTCLASTSISSKHLLLSQYHRAPPLTVRALGVARCFPGTTWFDPRKWAGSGINTFAAIQLCFAAMLVVLWIGLYVRARPWLRQAPSLTVRWCRYCFLVRRRKLRTQQSPCRTWPCTGCAVWGTRRVPSHPISTGLVVAIEGKPLSTAGAGTKRADRWSSQLGPRRQRNLTSTECRGVVILAGMALCAVVLQLWPSQSKINAGMDHLTTAVEDVAVKVNQVVDLSAVMLKAGHGVNYTASVLLEQPVCLRRARGCWNAGGCVTPTRCDRRSSTSWRGFEARLWKHRLSFSSCCTS